MKILHLIQKPQLRGAEIFASQLLNHLMDAGHEVFMISLLPGDQELPFKGSLIRLNRLNNRLIDFAGWRQLANYIKEIKPDVVQANAGGTLKFAVLSKLFFSWKSPIIFRNANKASDFIDSWPKLIFNKFLISQVSHVISVSELCRQDYIKTYGYSENKTTTVSIGIEIESINNSLPADLEPIFASGKVVVHVASFVPEKNHLGLLRIMKTLIENGENVKAVLIGDGRLKPSIKEKVYELKLQDHVYLVGCRSDVLNIMSNASALILPSNIEGLPGVILEAMICRTPVVAYDVGGISEVITPGETGWLVRAGDEGVFVAHIHEVLSAANLDTIIDNAYDLVVKKFDNRVIARRFIEVYGKILK